MKTEVVALVVGFVLVALMTIVIALTSPMPDECITYHDGGNTVELCPAGRE